MLSIRSLLAILMGVLCMLGVLAGSSVIYAADNASQSGADARDVIQQMVGTWNVRQRMWAGPGTRAIELSPAVARRRFVGNKFISEDMELAPGAGGDSFSRLCFINFNPVTRQYEYTSLDTRAPQTMSERGNGLDHGHGVISLQGGAFLAPQWGEMKNVRFRYRLTISPVYNNTQTVRLYFTRSSSPRGKEFVAFEYIYTRRK